MGTFKLSRLTPAEIVEKYLGGECIGLLSLRSRKPQYWVKDVLIAAGVTLRTPAERAALMNGSRTLKPRRHPPPPGSNPWGTP